MKELSKEKLLEIFERICSHCPYLYEASKTSYPIYQQAYEQIKQLISQSERKVDGWYIKEKAKEFYEAVQLVGSCARNWIEHDEDKYIHEFKDIIRSIIQEINMPETKVSKEGKVKELDRDKLLEIVRIKLIGCQPCNGCELKTHCLLPQAHEQVKQIISQQETQVDEKYIDEKAEETILKIEAILRQGTTRWFMEKAKDFLRQFASEIQKPRIDVLECVKKWLEIKAKNQQGIDPYKYSLYQLPADIDHSDLLQRLLEGKEPYPPKEKEKE